MWTSHISVFDSVCVPDFYFSFLERKTKTPGWCCSSRWMQAKRARQAKSRTVYWFRCAGCSMAKKGRPKWHSFYCYYHAISWCAKKGIASFVTHKKFKFFSPFGLVSTATVAAAAQCTHFSHSLLPFLIHFSARSFVLFSFPCTHSISVIWNSFDFARTNGVHMWIEARRAKRDLFRLRRTKNLLIYNFRDLFSFPSPGIAFRICTCSMVGAMRAK